MQVQHKKGQNPYFKLKDIAKTFGITKALSGVTLDIYAGEVIGLVGPNGAGKSTLMKILTGILPQTDGTIEIEGRTEEHYNTKLAKKYGVACAYQDLSLCTNLSVYENFALLNVSHKIVDKPGWRTQAKKNAKELLEKYFPGNGIDVTKPVSKLSLADQQVVEICKTLMTDNLKILILDEPTSALSTDKAGQLHKVVEELSQKGVAVIYISHKLDEIGIVSDRIVILRNGQNVGEIELVDSIFNVEVNEHVLYEVVKNQLANKRQGTQSAKTRAEVRGGGRKPWKQKGTGRARQGSIRAVQWVGGGVAFAPKPRSYNYTLPKKVRRLAMKSALTSKVQNGEMIVLDALNMEAPKTKEFVQILKNVNAAKKALVVTAENNENVIKSAKNIEGVATATVNTINVYDILKYDSFIITTDAVKKVEEVYA